jgi:hypothetical protein
MSYEDEYIRWLYHNYTIPNGDVLISYLEDGFTYDKFLKELGLQDE